jgi:tRNA-Thr(GGU) m(6)t(6)A37 methyltransferase TsaA
MIFHAIGVVRSPFSDIEGMPIQPSAAENVDGTIELAPCYIDGLKDLDGFSHIILLYYFHASEGFSLTVAPFLDETPRGVFATRAPRRPNPIGLSIVRLTGIDGTTLHIRDVDILDGTPLLDIKPFVPAFDNREHCQAGWATGKLEHVGQTKADGRFRHSQ